jgi:hypothetical protein
MVRGRRLPLPQSPLSRWRTTAPAPAPRRVTSTALCSFTTAGQRTDNKNDESTATKSERGNGQAERAKPRLRIHKIRVYGDDWALIHARASASPASRHVRSSLQGKKPFGDRSEYQRSLATYEEHLAAMNARRESRRPPQRADPVDQVKEAKGTPIRKVPPHKRAPEAPHWGTGTYCRRLLVNDAVPRQVPKEDKQVPLGHAGQLEDGPHRSRQTTTGTQADVSYGWGQGIPARGQSLTADQPQNSLNARDKLDSRMRIPPKVEKAITRQYKLVASGDQPLFSPRPPSAPSLQAQPQAKPTYAEQDLGELPVAAAGMGPAESLQRSFTEDPVLMRAQSLAGQHQLSTQPSSLFGTNSKPRFRLVRAWPQAPENTPPKTPRLPKDKPKSLESHISELQLEDETKGQAAQPGQTSDAKPSRPVAVDLDQSEVTSDVELKNGQDGRQAATQHDLTLQNESRRVDVDGDTSAEPVQTPAPDNRPIFEKLFAEQERPKRTDREQLSSRLRATMEARRRETVDLDQQDILEAAPHENSNAEHELSIFHQLFPKEAEPQLAQTEPETPSATHEILQPPENSVMVSLRNQVRNWALQEGQEPPTLTKPGDHGSHSTVVVISGISPSLMDTDFYRIAPEGQHVEGWAGGLAKVIQAHDSISYDPLGQYYLMFLDRPSALAYVSEVGRLHELSRKLLHAPGDSGRETAKGPLAHAPTSPQAFLTDEERAAVRSFTLFSPHITPYISVRMWNTELVQELTAKSNIADILPTLRPEASTPARVLVKVTSPDGQHGEGQGGLTTDELWLTLRDDGRERSAPWVLANLSEGIMPVKPRFISDHYKISVKSEPVSMPLNLEQEREQSEDGGREEDGPVAGPSPPRNAADGKDDAAVDRNERFTRFVLTFAQPAIARRFVRCWHKRVLYDALLNRSVVIDAVAIM